MSTSINPFVGLRPFESDESLLFFGRQQQTSELLEQLHKHHFVAIVGSSGSGKSSLIRAGLIPSLKAGYLVQDRDSWMMAVMKPGKTPLYNLVQAILSEINPNSDEEDVNALIERIKEQGEEALIGTLQSLWTVENKNVFILVDQFEELFRFSGEVNTVVTKNEAIEFVNIILSLAAQPQLPIYVVITIRSDFIGECSQFYGLPEAMNASQYLVPRLNRIQLKNAITGPIAIAGAAISNSLLNNLLNDIGDNQDQLPILQHALMRTFDVWQEKNTSQPIGVTDYQQIGTMAHALSQHAEEAYNELNIQEKQVCQKMFKALTDKRIGAKGVRRPQTFSDLLLITGANAAELSNVINVFRKSGRAFIMPPEKVYLTPPSIIDISHESLMRVWDRLQTWVNEESESKQIYLRLSEAADLYAQEKAGLWRNPELQIALLWKERNAPNVTWAAQVNSRFEQAMQFLEKSQRQDQQERREKELAQKRRLKRARKNVAVLSVLLFLAVGAIVAAYILRAEAKKAQKQGKLALLSAKDAKEQKAIAERNALKADSAAKRDSVSALEAQNAMEFANLQEKTAKYERDNALKAKDLAQKDSAIAVKRAAEAQQNAALAEANKQRAEENQRQTETLKRLADSRNLAIKAVAQMNEKLTDSSRMNAQKAYDDNLQNNGAVQDNNIFKALYVNWNAIINNRNQFNKHKYPVHAITGTKDYIFTADESGRINVSSIIDDTLQLKHSFNTQSEIRTLATSPNGNRLAAFNVNANGFLFDVVTDGALSKLAAPYLSFTGICKAAFFYDNNQILLLSTTGITQFNINDKTAEVYNSPDFKAMYISQSGHIYLATTKNVFVYDNWDAIKKNAGKLVLTLNSNNGNICCLAIDVKEQYIAVGTYTGNIKVTTLGQSSHGLIMKLHQSSVNDLKFAYVTGNRLQLASAGADKAIRLIDVESFLKDNNTEEIIVLEGHNKWVYQLFYELDGKLLFSSGEDNKVMIWKPTMADLYETLLQKQ